MKMFFATAAMFVSLSANAAQELVRYTYSAGFSPRSGFETLVIQNDGKVKFHSVYTDHRTGKQEIVDKLIGKLTAERITALKAVLPKIKEGDLVDENPGPQCTDAPSSSIVVVAGNVEFHRFAGCHTYKNETTEATVVKSLVDGLVALSSM